MCTDPLAQLYLPRGQYVDCVRVADYCTVTVKETNVFHSQASIEARGLLATDYAIWANDFSASSYETGQRARWGGEEEAQGRAHKRRGTGCKVRREVKSLRKQINENGIFQIGFGRWSRDGVRKHFHGFSTHALNYNRRLVVGGNNNSFVERKIRKSCLEYRHRNSSHVETAGWFLTRVMWKCR